MFGISFNDGQMNVAKDPGLEFSYTVVRYQMVRQACQVGGGHAGGFYMFAQFAMWYAPAALVAILIASIFLGFRSGVEVGAVCATPALFIYPITAFRLNSAFAKDREKHIEGFKEYCKRYLPDGLDTFVVNLRSL